MWTQLAVNNIFPQASSALLSSRFNIVSKWGKLILDVIIEEGNIIVVKLSDHIVTAHYRSQLPKDERIDYKAHHAIFHDFTQLLAQIGKTSPCLNVRDDIQKEAIFRKYEDPSTHYIINVSYTFVLYHLRVLNLNDPMGDLIGTLGSVTV